MGCVTYSRCERAPQWNPCSTCARAYSTVEISSCVLSRLLANFDQVWTLRFTPGKTAMYKDLASRVLCCVVLHGISQMQCLPLASDVLLLSCGHDSARIRYVSSCVEGCAAAYRCQGLCGKLWRSCEHTRPNVSHEGPEEGRDGGEG